MLVACEMMSMISFWNVTECFWNVAVVFGNIKATEIDLYVSTFMENVQW